MKRFVAMCLCAALLLSGCSVGDIISGDGLLGILLRQMGAGAGDGVTYEQMTYTRPDPQEHDRILERCCNMAGSSTDLDAVVDMVYHYYEVYDRFYTNYNLAYIEYCRDFTSEEWAQEYEFCAIQTAVVDSGLEELYRALAQSPIREKLEGEDYFGAGYFDAYEGESVWSEQLLALFEEESRCISAYYDLSSQADSVEYYSGAYFDGYADALCQALIDLVQVRQEIADYLGYDSYVSFAYDYYYYRDYTPEQAMAYMDTIRTEMGPLYREISTSDVWACGYGYCSEREMFDYVLQAAQAMGGITGEAFSAMEQAQLYDISYSEKKFPTSFEVYLTAYGQPYVFVCPDRSEYDKLTFAHEFGHFATDYAAWGSYAGTDVLEVFSQGMEYLSLCYVQDADHLARYKMADCLGIYVEQAAYASFEQELYELTPMELTVDNVFRLYEEICRSFGIDFELLGWDPRDLVTVSHFYTDPLYIISYVVSNDAALQLYWLEQEHSGAGLAIFEDNLATEQEYFLAFVEEAGLESPFDPQRTAETAQLLRSMLSPAGSAR